MVIELSIKVITCFSVHNDVRQKDSGRSECRNEKNLEARRLKSKFLKYSLSKPKNKNLGLKFLHEKKNCNKKIILINISGIHKPDWS